MPGRYWAGEIDGIPLKDGAEDAGFQIKGAEAFDMGGRTGSSIPNALGVPQFQYIPVGVAGNRLEVSFLHVPAPLLRDVLEAIKVRIGAGEAFPCTFADGFQIIDANFKADLPQWYSRGEPDGGYVKDAVIKLISTGA